MTVVLFIGLSFFLLNPKIGRYYPGIGELISLTKAEPTFEQYKGSDNPLRFDKCDYFSNGIVVRHGTTTIEHYFFRYKNWKSLSLPSDKIMIRYKRGWKTIKAIKGVDTIWRSTGPLNFQFSRLDISSGENLVEYYDAEFSTYKDSSDVRELHDPPDLQFALNQRTFTCDSLIIQYGYNNNQGIFNMTIERQGE